MSYENKIFSSLFMGALVGQTIRDFPPIVNQFFASPLGTFILFFGMLYILERKIGTIEKAFTSAIIYTLFLRTLIYGMNVWYEYRKDDDDIKQYEEDGTIIYLEK